MNKAKLYHMNGEIKSLFESEVNKRVRKEYPVSVERVITQNILTDPERAVQYSKRILAIKCEVKAEIETALGFSVDVGFEPETERKALPERVEELDEALTMILEGVTE